MNETEIEVVNTMSLYGGSFVKALAECFRRADRINFVKLREAFPDYWIEYQDMVIAKLEADIETLQKK